MEFRIAAAARTTGRLLESLLDAAYPPHERPDAVVCYGMGYSGPLPALNRNCGRLNKFEQGQRLTEGLDGSAVTALSFEEAMAENRITPMLGRKLQHTQGRDIVPILERWQLEASRGVCDFYTPYVPSVGEYRTWVYRNRHLGSYKKELAHPEQYRRLGRNYRNGFVFNYVEREAVPEAVKELARRAIRCLDLDFGAVDILDLENSYCVLEVNSAPGVAHERRAVINNLAHRVIRWAANGCPGRDE
jgi:hypothetical protein